MVKKRKNFLKNYIKVFLYFFIITILLSFSTIILHELGHFIFGILSNCYLVRIVLFDTQFMTTYTEMECPPSTNIFLLGLSGSFLIIPIAIILFFSKNKPDKYLAIIMFGFNILISIWDFENYLHLPYSILFAILGSIIIVVGEILLIEKTIF